MRARSLSLTDNVMSSMVHPYSALYVCKLTSIGSNLSNSEKSSYSNFIKIGIDVRVQLTSSKLKQKTFYQKCFR